MAASRRTSKTAHKLLSSQLTPTTTLFAMASLTRSSRTLLRMLPRSSIAPLPLRALCTSSTKRDATTSSFDSPFKGMGGDASSKIPDFSHYRSKQGTNSNLVFQYFMVGTMGALTAAGAKATVQGMWILLDGGYGTGRTRKVSINRKQNWGLNWNG
jgi:ubiquinol-cytochrome c reductase iron-sulfur subunit